MENRQTAYEKLIELAEKQGYVTFDNIMDCADEYSLPIQDFDWLSNSITTRGILVYSEAPTRNVPSDEDDFDDVDEDDTPVRKRSQSSSSSRKSTSFGRSSKIVPMRSSSASRSMEVCVSKPIDFNTCQEISDIILSGRAAIINFDAVTTQEAQRIIDFVSGSCYAINGSAKQISDSIVIVTPEDIDITGDLQDMVSSAVDVPAFGYSEEED